MFKKLKQTHLYIRRRGADGKLTQRREPVAQRAPLRVKTYSPAEKFMIVELMIFYSIDHSHVWLQEINHLVGTQLDLQKCTELNRDRRTSGGLRMPIDTAKSLIELKLLEVSDKRRPSRSPLRITAKGRRHIKRQSRRLQLCAQKLVYTDLLDKLVRAVG